jgi:hypothetical protein
VSIQELSEALPLDPQQALYPIHNDTECLESASGLAIEQIACNVNVFNYLYLRHAITDL